MAVARGLTVFRDSRWLVGSGFDAFTLCVRPTSHHLILTIHGTLPRNFKASHPDYKRCIFGGLKQEGTIMLLTASSSIRSMQNFSPWGWLQSPRATPLRLVPR